MNPLPVTVLSVTLAVGVVWFFLETSPPSAPAPAGLESAAAAPPLPARPRPALSTIRPHSPAVDPALIEQMTAAQIKDDHFTVGDQPMHPLQVFVEKVPLPGVPVALDAVRKVQAENPTAAGDELQVRLAWKWAAAQPLELAKWTEGSTGAVRGELFRVAATSLARQDLDGATEWAERLPDANDRQAALSGIAGDVAYTDPVAAIDIAEKLQDGNVRSDLILRATGAWAAEAPEDAVAWVQRLPDSAFKNEALSGVMTSLAESDPSEAARLLAESVPSGRLRAATVLGIVQRWALRDPDAANAWVKQFPAAPLRDAAAQMISDTVTRLNRPTASPLPSSM